MKPEQGLHRPAVHFQDLSHPFGTNHFPSRQRKVASVDAASKQDGRVICPTPCKGSLGASRSSQGHACDSGEPTSEFIRGAASPLVELHPQDAKSFGEMHPRSPILVQTGKAKPSNTSKQHVAAHPPNEIQQRRTESPSP